MCGRFIHTTLPRIYAQLLGIEDDELVNRDFRPRFNIAPSQPVLVTREPSPGQRELAPVRWGLIPFWSSGPDNRYSMINARVETVHQKPAYRGPFRYRRCLIPADGFYEWKALGKAKQPHCIRRKDGRPMAFGGIWDRWSDPDGAELDSCSIIVMPADDRLIGVHDRMPLMLAADAWDSWLDPEMQNTNALRELMTQVDRAELSIYPVSPRVNNPANDDADLIERYEPELELSPR